MEQRQVRVTINASEAGRQLGEFESEVDELIEKLENLQITPDIDTSGIEELADGIEDLDPTIEVDVLADSTSIEELDAAIENIDSEVFVEVSADGTEIDEIAAQVSELDSQTVDINVEAASIVEYHKLEKTPIELVFSQPRK